MRKFITMLAIYLLLMLVQAAPAFSDSPTKVFSEIKASCQKIEAVAWPKDITKEFREPKAAIDQMEKCDGYLVITAHFKYDPQGDTNTYFHPLFYKILQANKRQPFFIIDKNDNIVIDVDQPKQDEMNIQYESLNP